MPTKTFPAEHPVFAGHFPGRPIVPGVMLLDWVLAESEKLTAKKVKAIQSAKFQSPALPQEVLQLELEESTGRMNFKVLCKERMVASGKLILE